ncbi:fructosamine kinase family protein [Shimia sediminis]|uniref:fructosamine kinase family protein n=1 Tax=Shimia sediminis TaxID=2497945 RepID=UPI0027B99AD9|nr:fructosamine kinase family protein [Shimia sediminis]
MGALSSALDRATRACLGASIAQQRRLHGGDLSDVYHLTLRDGRQVVAKHGPLVTIEAQMLGAIRTAGAPAPEVLGVRTQVMLIEALPETPATAQSWEALGDGLRQLHETVGPHYGWDTDYAFGPVTIPNAPKVDWCDFWLENRLLANPAALPNDIVRRLETLGRRLPDLMPVTPPAALLHGDIWTGNALFTGKRAYLIDPACYHGHSEVDLAMLCLFGMPPEAFWSGYGVTDPGLDARRPLYQLWPALVHLRLFGDSYRAMVDTRLAALGV